MSRPGWHRYFLGIADAVAKRGDCTRRRVGAVIVKDRRIVATGYNGSPAGHPGCLSDGACPRGQHYWATSGHDFKTRICACGGPWPCPDSAVPRSSYDTGPGACIAVHAEANAIIYAGRDACLGGTLYVTCRPCDGCYRLIGAAGLREVRVKGDAECACF